MDTYEKKYKDALERASKLRFQNPFDTVSQMVEYIFPELKESENEKIRKAIHIYLDWLDGHKDYQPKGDYTIKDMIAWLEKQGKETSWKPSKEEMDVLYGLAYITNQYDEHKEEVITRLYQDLKREFFNGSSYENMFPNTSTEDDVRRRSTIQVLEYARTLDTYNQYGKADIDKNIAWLEKQGGQKPTDKVESFDKYEGLTDFERTLADICIGWIGEEPGWKQYIKDNADVLLKIAVEKFNSVQDVPFEQKPAWSEEDEVKINRIVACLENLNVADNDILLKDVDWLKSLRPQNRWKPTKQQLSELRCVISGCSFETSVLVELEKNLKKLL